MDPVGSRSTQQRILESALTLFNEHGSAAISTNRIAAHCGISKGNLHYHFRNKQEIILSLFQSAIEEMNSGWYRDHLVPTLEHMAVMFVRQLQLILKYRFFYRELADLLRHDELLRLRFADNRSRRLMEIERFFLSLADRGLMRIPADVRRLRSIIDVTWIVSENWLNYLDYDDREVNVDAIIAGYYEILEVLRPYLCADPNQITEESYMTIERLAAQAATPENSEVDDPA